MADIAKAALCCFGNPMIDMFLTLPQSACDQVHAVSQGKSHLKPDLFDQLLEVLHNRYPESMHHLSHVVGGGAVNMSRLLRQQHTGVEISLSGAVGSDESGGRIADELQLFGIHTDFQVVDDHTGRILYIAYLSHGRYAGFEVIASPAAARTYPGNVHFDVSGSDVFVEGFFPDGSGLRKQIGGAVDPGHIVILDLGSRSAAGEAASLIHAVCRRKLQLIIFGTEDEMESLYRIMSKQDLLEAQAVLVVKQGECGACVITRSFSHHHPAVLSQVPASEILTVGAGDAFCAGFLTVVYQEPLEYWHHPERLCAGLAAGSEFAARIISDRINLLRPSYK